MNDSARSRPLTPCFFTGRLVEGSEVELVSVTRIGATAAQLSGQCPVPVGGYTVLEFDRPTDGERAPSVRIRSIRTEGAQWGWKPAIHVDLLDPVGQAPPQPADDAIASALPLALDGPDGEPVRVESLSLSFDDTAEDLAAAPMLEAEQLSQLTREQATRIALGAVDPDAGRALRATMNADGALPAMYVAPPGRRDEASSPWAPATDDPSAQPAREPRVLANSPAAYQTSGRHRAGMVQDFSRGGMFMAVYQGEVLPPVGAIIRVEFAIPDRGAVYLVGMTAEVRWVYEGDRPTEPGRGAGLAITGFDRARGREVYEKYVNGLVEGE